MIDKLFVNCFSSASSEHVLPFSVEYIVNERRDTTGKNIFFMHFFGAILQQPGISNALTFTKPSSFITIYILMVFKEGLFVHLLLCVLVIS